MTDPHRELIETARFAVESYNDFKTDHSQVAMEQLENRIARAEKVPTGQEVMKRIEKVMQLDSCRYTTEGSYYAALEQNLEAELSRIEAELKGER